MAPQSDGEIHVTAGYKLAGFIILKVKNGEKCFHMSALSLSLVQVEGALNVNCTTRTRY